MLLSFVFMLDMLTGFVVVWSASRARDGDFSCAYQLSLLAIVFQFFATVCNYLRYRKA